MITCYFSIIRYVPEVFRKEFINIGILLSVPEKKIIKFRTFIQKSRLNSFAPNFNQDIVSNFEEIMDNVLAQKSHSIFNNETNKFEDTDIYSKAFLEDFIRTHRGSKIQFGELNWIDFEIDNIDDIHVNTTIFDLINKYVKAAPKIKKIHFKTTPFKRDIILDFKQNNLISKRAEQKGIIPNYRFEELDWSYDFGLENDGIHLYETIDFSNSVIDSKINVNALKKTAYTYIKFLEAKRLAIKKKQYLDAMTIYKATSDQEKVIKKELELLAEQSKLFNYYSESQRSSFFKIIKSSIEHRSL